MKPRENSFFFFLFSFLENLINIEIGNYEFNFFFIFFNLAFNHQFICKVLFNLKYEM